MTIFTTIVCIILGIFLSYLFFSKDDDNDEDDGITGGVAIC